MRQETINRLERQEQRHAPAAAHVAIYDTATGQPLNGSVPATAQVVIFIPHNNRDEVTSERS